MNVDVFADGMKADHDRRDLGLRQVSAASNADTTLDIIAIHGLGTQSPRTWQYRQKPEDGGGVVDWLADADMLPAVVPEARVFTYDWNADYFKDAPVQTLLGHADTLLAHLMKDRGRAGRPIIFVASCFGGLILAEAVNRAAQTGSAHKDIILSIAGIVFLATPFRGSDAANQAQWQVVVGGIMGEQTSSQLVDDLNSRDKELRKLTQTFAEIARRDSIQNQIFCFYETKETEMLRKFLSSRSAPMVTSVFKNTKKILVTEDSACLDALERLGLNATHSGMNKFRGPTDANFELVSQVIRKFAKEGLTVVKGRQRDSRRCHFVVPRGRNRGFVGREAIVNLLLEMIPPGKDETDCQRTAIEGLGGAGKTQIALEAVYRVHETYPDCSVFWVSAIDAGSFENDYRAIGQRLAIPGIEDREANIKKLVKEALSQESAGSWLLIIDNADDSQLLFSNPALCEHLPFSRNGSILFTTRNHEVTGSLDIHGTGVITVAEMSRAESVMLLQKDLKQGQTQDAESTTTLLDFLANHALAIKQASSYMHKTGITTTRYLHHCQSSDKTLIKLLGRGFEDRLRDKALECPIITTWLISFENIVRDMPLAAHYLKFMCFLAEKDIPTSLLPPADDEMDVDEAIGTLKAYAFIIQRDGSSSFDIHRLVRLAVRNWLDEKGEWAASATTVIQRLAKVFPYPEYENRHSWLQWLRHAETAFKSHADAADEEAKCTLLRNMSGSRYVLGDFREAERMYRQALKSAEEWLGPKHRATLACVTNLATTLCRLGQNDEAKHLQQQAFDLSKEVYGPTHPLTMTNMHRLANSFSRLGDYEVAFHMHQQILELTKEVLGPEHPHTLTSMTGIAMVLYRQGNYEEAERMHWQVVNSSVQILGPKHPSTLDRIRNLGRVLDSQQKHEEAERIYRQVFEGREQVLGPEHPDTLHSFRCFTVNLHLQGKHDEAVQIHRQMMALNKEVLGLKHPITLQCMQYLAMSLDYQGKLEEAEQTFRQTVALRKEVLGLKHSSTLQCIEYLAISLGYQGKLEEAEQTLRQTVALNKEVLGLKHPSTLQCMENLAISLENQGKHEEAEQIHRQTMALNKERLGLKHPSTLECMEYLAISLCRQGKLEEAEQIHRQTMALNKEVLGPEHPSTLQCMENLAISLGRQGKLEEAEQIHRQTMALRKEVLGPEHPSNTPMH